MKWFKHDSDANADNRLQNVLLDYGLEGYGLYWYCLELIAGRVDKERVTFELEHDARVIARNTGSTPQKVEEMMRYFVSIGLFENMEGVITCLKMAKRLDKSMTSNTEMRKIIEGLASNNTVLDGYVYFIEKIDSTGTVIAIKIGRSKNPSARLSELAKLDENVGFKLQQVHKLFSDNCVALETEMHRKFKDFCIYNEWFKPVSEIYAEIKSSYVMTTTDYGMQEEKRLEIDKETDIKDSSGNGDAITEQAGRKKYSFTPEDMTAAEYIADKVDALAGSLGNHNLQSWANTIRLMRERDGRNHREICDLFKWANRDSFWKDNVLSPDTLRKQWQKLTIRRNSERNGTTSGRPALDFNNTDWADKLGE